MRTRWSQHDHRPRKGTFTLGACSDHRQFAARQCAQRDGTSLRIRASERQSGGKVGCKRAGRLRWRTSDADMNGMRCHYRGVHTDNSMPRSANEGVCTDRAKALNFPAILSPRVKHPYTHPHTHARARARAHTHVYTYKRMFFPF